ncbi:universal stress protein [Psychrosphaera haliotis]|uniref:Universal stress protein n=1 Tax=Psychrosphaera haliotis TaxID=555083 RepID=A0A6N8F7Z8_9GAMM|nr:universal stress protein [Psychrosphaera haliotis]MUH72695.1 universal stress protein [Psychrosphaera haliotis]
MYQKIVCAIEASDEGKLVLEKACGLAKAYNAKLYVAHVIPYSILPKDYQKTLEEEAAPLIDKITESFGISQKKVSIKVGKPYEQICLVADKKEADLIVIGTHSKKGIQALIGSTANGVVNYAKCDVFLVKI